MSAAQTRPKPAAMSVGQEHVARSSRDERRMRSVTYMASEATAVNETSMPPDTMTIMQPTEKRPGTIMARARSTRLLPVKNCPDLAWIRRLEER